MLLPAAEKASDAAWPVRMRNQYRDTLALIAPSHKQFREALRAIPGTHIPEGSSPYTHLFPSQNTVQVLDLAKHCFGYVHLDSVPLRDNAPDTPQNTIQVTVLRRIHLDPSFPAIGYRLVSGIFRKPDQQPFCPPSTVFLAGQPNLLPNPADPVLLPVPALEAGTTFHMLHCTPRTISDILHLYQQHPCLQASLATETTALRHRAHLLQRSLEDDIVLLREALQAELPPEVPHNDFPDLPRKKPALLPFAIRKHHNPGAFPPRVSLTTPPLNLGFTSALRALGCSWDAPGMPRTHDGLPTRATCRNSRFFSPGTGPPMAQPGQSPSGCRQTAPSRHPFPSISVHSPYSVPIRQAQQNPSPALPSAVLTWNSTSIPIHPPSASRTTS